MQQIVHESLKCYSGEKLMCRGKEGNELCNPYWQVVRHRCATSVPQQKRGNTLKHRTSPTAKKFRLCQSVFCNAVGFSHVKFMHQAQQAVWTLALIHRHLCQAIWDLDISLEVWPFSMTVQPHTAHIKHESSYSHFRGNLWTIHLIVLDFASVGLSFIWATEAALGTLLIPQ